MYLVRILVLCLIFFTVGHSVEKDKDKVIESQRVMMQDLADSLQSQRKVNSELNYIVTLQEYMIIKMADLKELSENQKYVVNVAFPALQKAIEEDKLKVEVDIKKKILYYYQLMKDRKIIASEKK